MLDLETHLGLGRVRIDLIGRVEAVLGVDERQGNKRAHSIHRNESHARDERNHEHAHRRAVRVVKREHPYATPQVYIRKAKHEYEDLELGAVLLVSPDDAAAPAQLSGRLLGRAAVLGVVYHAEVARVLHLYDLDQDEDDERDEHRHNRIQVLIRLKIDVLCVPDDAPHEHDQV